MGSRSNDSFRREFPFAAHLGNWAGILDKAIRMGGPIPCWAARRAKALLFAAGALVMCLGNLDCQAGTIISQSHRSPSDRPAAIEFDWIAQAGMSEAIAGQAETENANPVLPLPRERSGRLKAPMKALLGECGGA